ncbi:unnamed protein product [Camellia sinensis]
MGWFPFPLFIINMFTFFIITFFFGLYPISSCSSPSIFLFSLITPMSDQTPLFFYFFIFSLFLLFKKKKKKKKKKKQNKTKQNKTKPAGFNKTVGQDTHVGLSSLSPPFDFKIYYFFFIFSKPLSLFLPSFIFDFKYIFIISFFIFLSHYF